MVTERLEVRLDRERKQRLGEIAEFRGERVSDVIRALIDQAYAETDRERRHRAVLELVSMNIGPNPEPDELSRELDSMLDLPDLYPEESAASEQRAN